jgi:Protein of unknown function (DUF1517)
VCLGDTEGFFWRHPNGFHSVYAFELWILNYELKSELVISCGTQNLWHWNTLPGTNADAPVIWVQLWGRSTLLRFYTLYLATECWFIPLHHYRAFPSNVYFGKLEWPPENFTQIVLSYCKLNSHELYKIWQITILVAAERVHKLPVINSSSDLKIALQKLGSIPSSKIMVQNVSFIFF